MKFKLINYLALRSLGIAAILLILFSALAGQAFGDSLNDRVSQGLESLKLGAHEFDISTRRGTVTLSGFVSSKQDQEAVLNNVKSTEGVEKVINSLRVVDTESRANMLNDKQALDARIAEVSTAIDGYMQSAKLKGPYELKYEINDQGILISGELPAGVEKSALLYYVRRKVSTPIQDNIKVRPWPSDKELLARIRKRLSSDQGLDLKGIDFAVSEGVVSITGKRSIHSEADQIVAAVLMVEGVRNVRSEIAIGETRKNSP